MARLFSRFSPIRIAASALATAWLAVPVFAQTAAPPAPGQPLQFVRAVDAPEKLRAAQTLVAQYRKNTGDGPAIWLVGVAHIGTPEYYKEMQRRLDACTLVLFEGVDGDRMAQAAAPGDPSTQQNLQAQIAKSLGLVSQLESIDYRRPHFINSDMSMEEIRGAIRSGSPGEKGEKVEKGFDSLVEALRGEKKDKGAEGTEPAAEAPKLPTVPLNPMQMFAGGGDVKIDDLGAAAQMFLQMTNGSDIMKEMMRAMLVEAVGNAGEMLEIVSQQSPEMKELIHVILKTRNEAVLQTLRERLPEMKATESVAIFYGAAHMDEIAEKVRTEFQYSSVQEDWRTAFTADPVKAGIDPNGFRMMMQMLKPAAPAPAETPPGEAPKEELKPATGQ